jgi:hypothetical protein
MTSTDSHQGKHIEFEIDGDGLLRQGGGTHDGIISSPQNERRENR